MTETKPTGRIRITIQAAEGNYESTQTKDNGDTCPVQKQLNLSRYHISVQSRYIHNAPKYIATKTMETGQVLKINTNKTNGTYREIWEETRNVIVRNL